MGVEMAPPGDQARKKVILSALLDHRVRVPTTESLSLRMSSARFLALCSSAITHLSLGGSVCHSVAQYLTRLRIVALSDRHLCNRDNSQSRNHLHLPFWATSRNTRRTHRSSHSRIACARGVVSLRSYYQRPSLSSESSIAFCQRIRANRDRSA